MTDIHNNLKHISGIRRDYGIASLDENSVLHSPFDLFELWFSQVLQVENNDPTAMVLSTIDKKNHPDSRVVLLKGIEKNAFIFFSNYQSTKGIQLKYNSYAALNFYWPQMARQVRIKGKVKMLSATRSDAYFATRPLKSQLSAIISPQSRMIDNREELEEKLVRLYKKGGEIVRPDYWGGYELIPKEFEFWQGRDNRLHDRIKFTYQKTKWIYHRLAP